MYVYGLRRYAVHRAAEPNMDSEFVEKGTRFVPEGILLPPPLYICVECGTNKIAFFLVVAIQTLKFIPAKARNGIE